MNRESTARAPEVIALNDSIFQLYRPAGTRSMQVVFFHGFQLEDYESAHTNTWTLQDGSVWPQTWLVEKFPGAHVLSVSYNRWVTNARDGGTMDMFNICENLRSDLLSANREESRCPIILVGHSFGGLVIKELCVEVSNRIGRERDSSTKASLQDFLNDVTGIFFYGTPHRGINNEALAVFTADNQSLLEYGKTLSKDAARTDYSFSPLTEVYNWQIAGLGESLPLKRNGFPDLEVVKEASSRYGSTFNIAGDTDHITITRPTAKIHRNFTALVDLLNEAFSKGVEAERPGRRRRIVETVNDIDGLYVPIEKPHSAVIKAIECLQGPSVILLHGGVGKGKSTLARSMIQRYGNQNDTKDGKVFDSVVWVSCGNCSGDDISTKQWEILQDHSPKSLGDSPEKEKTNPKPRISKAFQKFFDDKKILVILDDVSDDRFLYAMWEAARGGEAKCVKILVTSQWANICAKAGLKNDSFRIFMEDPTEGEAMTILATLVGLAGDCIPHHLQPIAKEMIEVTERNPLALACLASHFAYSEDNKDQQAWQDALQGLQKLLDNPEERLVLPVTELGKHADPRSLCGAMKICIDSLKTGDAKKILFLMYAFKEESAPELVLRILHASLRRSNCTFRKSRDELGMRELLKIHQEPQQPTSLSLRSLVKLYMEHTKTVGGNEIKSLIDELVHDIQQAPELSSLEIRQEDETDRVEWEKTRVAITLCALYFDLHHATVNKFVTDAMTRACITYSNDGLNDLRRHAIYPIVSLLDEQKDEHWKESDVSAARQVFLTYICKHELDYENISHLLELAASSTAQLATLKALSQICYIENVPLLKDNNLSFLQAILQLLDLNTGIPTSVLEEAAQTLQLVCWKAIGEQSTSLVIITPGVLDVLVKLMSSLETSATVQERATATLRNLLTEEGDVLKLRIVNEERALKGLVKLLSMHDQPKTQEHATVAIQNLTGTTNSSLGLLIANQEGALQSLVKLMSSLETSVTVQESATAALRNLITEEGDVLKLRIVNEERALEGLVKLLSMHDQPKTQEHATVAIQNLTGTTNSSLGLLIANQEGALQSLVKLMSSLETSATVQEIATAALRNLITEEGDVLKLRIVNEERALEGLVKLLSMHDQPKTQEHATVAIRNLTCTRNSSLGLLIANQEGALQSLVKLMSSLETSATVQESATAALRNLITEQGDDLKLRIVNEERALEGLVKLLSMHDQPKMQEHATVAIQNLTGTTNSSLGLLIANQEGALQSLVKLMSSLETSATVQESATAALRNLITEEGDVLKLRIVNEERALEGLVKLLSMHDQPKTQEHATVAIRNLTCTRNSSLGLLIANQEGALQSLVKLMSSLETSATVQESATAALSNLITEEGDVLKLRIVNEERALEGLVKLLSMHDQPKTQEHATVAIRNLTCTRNSSLGLLIANQEGALQSLVKLMSSLETSATVQESATAALRNLITEQGDVLKLRIVNEERALEGLVKLLSMHDQPKMQEHATVAIRNLTCTRNSSLGLLIANQEGALQSLVKLMSSLETSATVQESATAALRNLITEQGDDLKLRIVNEERALEGLVKLLSMHDQPKMQEHATAAIADLTFSTNSSLHLRIVNEEGALQSVVKLVSSPEIPVKVHEMAAQALGNLAIAEDDVVKLRIAREEGVVAGLLKCLAVNDRPVLQEFVGWALRSLTEFEEANAILKGREGVLKGLSSLLADGMTPNTQYIGARTLTLINPTQGKEAGVKSKKAYSGRADAFVFMEMFEEALRDLDSAVDLPQKDNGDVLCRRCFVKAKLGDLDGALDDANDAVKVSSSDIRSFRLQERGVLKQMLGDLEGSLADLNEALKLETEDYEMLKHRGYVKFLLRDEEGACADAEWALRIKPPRVDRRFYSRYCLGTTPVEYLGYKLR